MFVVVDYVTSVSLTRVSSLAMAKSPMDAWRYYVHHDHLTAQAEAHRVALERKLTNYQDNYLHRLIST